MPEVVVKKTDEVAKLRAFVEMVEGELPNRITKEQAEEMVRDGVKSAMADYEANIEARVIERIKAADKIGAAPGERVFVAGGEREHDLPLRQLGDVIIAARSLTREGRLPSEKMLRYLKRDMLEGTGTHPLVPVVTADGVIRFIGERSIIRGIARMMQMTTDQIVLPIEDEKGDAYFPAENVDATASDITFKPKDESILQAESVVVHRVVSRDLSDDALIAIAPYIAEVSAERIARAENLQAFVGSGSPFTGVVNTSGVPVVQLSDGKTSFGDLEWDNLAEAEFQVDEDALGDLTWITSKAAFLEAFRMKNDQGNPIWATQWSAGLPTVGNMPKPRENRPGLLSGYPAYITKTMPTNAPGAVSFIIGSFMQGFVFGDRRSLEVEWDDSIYRKKRKSAVFFSERIGMKVTLPKAFCIVKNADS
ncbi:phage major capsid protein [Candidatus Binatia bacterium]|nr:phage major capsid protein [Candidatus Binatia bacterium]